MSFLLWFSVAALAKEIDTNALKMPNAPDWLNRPRVEKVIDRMQTKLEWTIRKIEVRWYTSEADFLRAQSLGPGVLAVADKKRGLISLGPSVNSGNFDAVFGHELVHIVLGQKYGAAVPAWIEEGLANHLAGFGRVDYKWLARQTYPDDVRALVHPFKSTVRSPHYHYEASHALAEMIARKCDMENLLRLSVERKMEDYLVTYCELPDVNAAFREWVKKKAG